MPVYQIIGMLLWQSLAQDFKTFSAIASTRDYNLPIHRYPALILYCWNKPGSLRIMRMNCNGKTEDGWFDICNLFPGCPSILCQEDSVVMLCPDSIRIGRTLSKSMRILDILIFSPI